MENAATLNETWLNLTFYTPYVYNDFWRYPLIAVIVFGIFGNTLVIIFIVGQRCLLKNNYYFLVLHLTICDLLWLLMITLTTVNFRFAKGSLLGYSVIPRCVVEKISIVLQATGIGMMLTVSVLRYRATVHPLKPATSRRKLKVVCGLMYVVGFIAGYGPAVPSCFVLDVIVYEKFHFVYIISCFYFLPTIFMTLVYFKIARTLIKQNRRIKSVCSNSARSSAPRSSFNIMKSIRNRRTFLVCLIIVICFGVGHVPISVWLIWFITGKYHLMMKYFWLHDLASILRLAGTHSINPLIYGILDKKLFTFRKLCCKKTRRLHED